MAGSYAGSESQWLKCESATGGGKRFTQKLIVSVRYNTYIYHDHTANRKWKLSVEYDRNNLRYDLR